MPRYVIKDTMRFVMMSGELDDKTVFDAVMENNERAEILEPLGEFDAPVVIVCDNKPRDLPEYGIEWIEEILM